MKLIEIRMGIRITQNLKVSNQSSKKKNTHLNEKNKKIQLLKQNLPSSKESTSETTNAAYSPTLKPATSVVRALSVSFSAFAFSQAANELTKIAG